MNKITLKVLIISMSLTIFNDLKSPVGLANEGATCYINSTLQALFACNPFVSLIERLHDQKKFLDKSVGDELYQLIINHKFSEASIKPTEFIQCISKVSLMGSLAINSQQDAGEFFIQLIAKLDEKGTGVSNVFNINILARGIPSVLITVNAPIANDGMRLIDMVNNYFDKSTPLVNTGDIFVIQPIRALFGQKDMKTIHYDLLPLTLDIQKKKVAYKPIAVVLHAGETVRSGHYIAVVCYDNTWYICDDSFVSPISFELATQIINGEKFIINQIHYSSFQSFLFFFERSPEAHVVIPEAKKQTKLNQLFSECIKSLNALYLGTRLLS